MKFGRAILVALSLAPLCGLGAAPFLPLATNHDLIVPNGDVYERVSVLLVMPRDVSQYVLLPAPTPREYFESIKRMSALTGEDEKAAELARFSAYAQSLIDRWRDPQTGEIQWAFQEKALEVKLAEAQRLLKLAHDYALNIYETQGKYGGKLPAPLRAILAKILTGEHPVVLVTHHRDTGNILQTIAVTRADSLGRLPPQERLIHRGLPAHPPDLPVRLSHEPRPYISPVFPGEHYPLADEMFNLVPVWRGGRLGITMYARDESSDIPWGMFLRRFLISQGVTRFTAEPVPELIVGDDAQILSTYVRLKAAAKEEHELIAIRKAFWDIYVGRAAVNQVWAEELMVEAIGKLQTRAYARSYGLTERYTPPFIDPELAHLENPPINSLLKAKVVDYELDAVKPSRWYGEGYPLADPFIRDSVISSPFDDEFYCADLVLRTSTALDYWESNIIHARLQRGARP